MLPFTVPGVPAPQRLEFAPLEPGDPAVIHVEFNAAGHDMRGTSVTVLESNGKTAPGSVDVDIDWHAAQHPGAADLPREVQVPRWWLQYAVPLPDHDGPPPGDKPQLYLLPQKEFWQPAAGQMTA